MADAAAEAAPGSAAEAAPGSAPEIAPDAATEAAPDEEPRYGGFTRFELELEVSKHNPTRTITINKRHSSSNASPIHGT